MLLKGIVPICFTDRPVEDGTPGKQEKLDFFETQLILKQIVICYGNIGRCSKKRMEGLRDRKAAASSSTRISAQTSRESYQGVAAGAC